MKKFLSYDQFEAEWKQESIPQIDLNKVRLQVIGAGDTNRRTLKNKKKMVLVIAVLIFTICFGTVAMAIYNGWQLKNKNGDVLLNYVKGELPELSKLNRGWGERLKFFEVENEILNSLAPGEMAYFFVTKEYEISKYVPVLQREERIADLKKLRESTNTMFKVPEYLPNNYQFEYGIVTYKVENENDKIGEALYKQAKKTGENYIIQKGKLTKEAKSIKLKYVNPEGYKLTIHVNDINERKTYDFDTNTYEKLTISDQEVLYIKSKWDLDDTYVFAEEGAKQNLIYYITNITHGDALVWNSSRSNLPLPKDEAVKIIESFK